MLKYLISILALVLAFACATVPISNRERLAPVPESYMDNLGATAYEQLKQKTPIVHDAAQTAQIAEVGRQIAKATGEDLAWEFTLFNSKEVNAFCLPGGKVGVYTGILPVAKTNAGLATILGHEVGHAIAQHAGERMSQQILMNGALLSVDYLLGNSTKRPIVMAALGMGAQYGIVLPYSRTQEAEADQLGLVYMARAGYDPHEAITLWQRMAKLGGAPPEFLSDHPDSAKRAAALEAQLPRAMAIYAQAPTKSTVQLLAH